MAIWTRTPNLEPLRESSKNTPVGNMGIGYREVGEDYFKGRMPVDERTVRPFGIPTAVRRYCWRKPWAAWRPTAA